MAEHGSTNHLRTVGLQVARHTHGLGGSNGRAGAGSGVDETTGLTNAAGHEAAVSKVTHAKSHVDAFFDQVDKTIIEPQIHFHTEVSCEKNFHDGQQGHAAKPQGRCHAQPTGKLPRTTLSASLISAAQRWPSSVSATCFLMAPWVLAVELLVQGLIAGAGTLYTCSRMVGLLGPARAALSTCALFTFDINFVLPHPLVALYASVGNDLPVINNNGLWVLPIPATYVIDRQGRIAFAHIEADYRERAEPDVVLGVVDRLRDEALI